MAKIAIILIKFYQYLSHSLIRYNTPLLIVSPQCRFYPSCSEYALESIEKYGFQRGIYKSLVRILKCNPLTP